MRKLWPSLAVLLLAACGEGVFRESAEYLIEVDSIVVPEVVASNQPFTILFYGTVGPNDCFSFNRFRTQQQAQRLDVMVIGRYTSTGRCGPATPALTGEPLEVAPPFEDPFTIAILQPGGGSLTREVAVR